MLGCHWIRWLFIIPLGCIAMHAHAYKWFVARNESTSHAIVIFLTNIIISVIPIPTIFSSGNRTTLKWNIIKTKCNSTSKTKTDNVHGERESMENVVQLCTECNPIYFTCASDLIGLVFVRDHTVKNCNLIESGARKKISFLDEMSEISVKEIVLNWFRSVHKESWHKKKMHHGFQCARWLSMSSMVLCSWRANFNSNTWKERNKKQKWLIC